MEVTVDSKRAPEHPKVYTWIKLVYKIYGKNLEQYKDKIEKAINLSQNKYCSISEMIRNANIPLEHEYELIEDED
jgi:putative redox protein